MHVPWKWMLLSVFVVLAVLATIGGIGAALDREEPVIRLDLAELSDEEIIYELGFLRSLGQIAVMGTSFEFEALSREEICQYVEDPRLEGSQLQKFRDFCN